MSSYEGCSERNDPHFFLWNYLFRMYEIHAQCNWMFPLHTLFFHISPFTSAALRQRETRACMPSLYQLISYSRNHVLTARITLSSSSKLVPRSLSFSGPKRWKSDGARWGILGGWGRSVQIWRLSPGFVDLCEEGHCLAESTYLLDSC